MLRLCYLRSIRNSLRQRNERRSKRARTRAGGGRADAGREEDRSDPTEGDQEYDTGVCLHRSLELSSTSKTIFVPLW